MSLLTNLIAYWKLDEASGNATDSVGSNTLADNNSVGSAAGKIGNARSFASASSQFLSIADNADVSTGDIDFSVACWIKVTTLPASFAVLVGKGASSEYNLWLTLAGELRWSVYDTGGSEGRVSWGTNLSTGTWYHVVGWHDSVNNLVGLSVNGGTAVTGAWSTGAKDGTGPFRLSGRSTGDLYYDGLIDEAGLWKRVLAGQDRTDLYGGGSGLAFSSFGGAAFVAPMPYLVGQGVKRASTF